MAKKKLSPEEEKMWEEIREESAGMDVMEMQKISNNMSTITRLAIETKSIIVASNNRKFWKNIEEQLTEIIKIIKK